MTAGTRKPEAYRQARRLRAEGLPYKRIAAELGVSASSVFAWTHDIELTEEQVKTNLRGRQGPLNPAMLARRAAAWSNRCRERRLEYQSQGRAHARKGDPLHLAGCMLYWAEGAKKRNTVQFCNSDPAMHRLFRRFLTEALGVDPTAFRIRLNVYTGNGVSLEEVEDHWLDVLDLPSTCLRSHTINHLPTSSSGRAKNKLPFGVCTIRVDSTRLVQHIYGAIQEYGCFEEPAWLD